MQFNDCAEEVKGQIAELVAYWSVKGDIWIDILWGEEIIGENL